MPTPLASGGVGLFIVENLNYTLLEKEAHEAFQALWIEISFSKQKNVICGILYRQHNSPDCFIEYFSDTIEKLASTGKTIYIMGDFNPCLLKTEKFQYSQDFYWPYKSVISFQLLTNQHVYIECQRRLLIIFLLTIPTKF